MSSIPKIIATALVAAGAFGAATPASAVVETFAAYQAMSSARNIRFVNSGNSLTRPNDGRLFTTMAGTTAPGTAMVRFSFLQPELNRFVQNVVAAFTLDAAITAGTPVTGNPFTQTRLGGSFSFISTADITVNSTFYAAGSNLLSATFSGAGISGSFGGTSGATAASTLGGATIVYTSDFLDFGETVNRDFGLTMTAVNAPFSQHAGRNAALSTFRAVSSGQFSSDPAPIVNAVIPEPAVWGLMVVGFGLVGVQVRRRTVSLVTA